MPTDTGEPGGKQTGQYVTHYITPVTDRFEQVFKMFVSESEVGGNRPHLLAAAQPEGSLGSQAEDQREGIVARRLGKQRTAGQFARGIPVAEGLGSCRRDMDGTPGQEPLPSLSSSSRSASASSR